MKFFSLCTEDNIIKLIDHITVTNKSSKLSKSEFKSAYISTEFLSIGIPEVVETLMKQRCLDYFMDVLEQKEPLSHLCCTYLSKIVRTLLNHDDILFLQTMDGRDTISKIMVHLDSQTTCQIIVDVLNSIEGRGGLESVAEFLRSTKLIKKLLTTLYNSDNVFVCFVLLI